MDKPKQNTSDPGMGTIKNLPAPAPLTRASKPEDAKTTAQRPNSKPKPDGGSITSYISSISNTRRASFSPNQNKNESATSRFFIPYPSSILQSTRSFKSSSLANMKKGLDEKVQLRFRKAIRNHLVFSVHPSFPAIRKALLDRGWIEKLRGYNVMVSNPGSPSTVALSDRISSEETERDWMNRGLRDYSPDFHWIFLGDRVQWSTMNQNQIINQFPSSVFTTKNGITSCLQNAHWFSESGIASANFPRCYRLYMDEERSAFINDFRLTACIGLLKWVIGAYERNGDKGILESNPIGRSSTISVEFAVRQVNYYVRVRKHEDVDWLTPPAVTSEHWEIFLSQYYNVVINKAKLSMAGPNEGGQHIYESSKRAIRRLAPFWPQLHSDGTNNVWICKPGDKSRGMGIVLMSHLDKILNSFNPAVANRRRDSNWVVQKYIERPLLIYNTKFDIRQWFLVTDWNPLTVWFYKESYLRFCSRPFTIDDYHESIHLTNNAVQVRYQNQYTRDKALPNENMWDNYTFQAYLKSIGKLEIWDRMVYPAMKQGVLCVLLASQENIPIRKNCFELYGADFMLSEDFIPWLIEINSCPCMSPTTTVTARMCWQCLYDCIKVVIDRRENPKADTGFFELIYKQNKTLSSPSFVKGMDTVLMGHKFEKETTDWPRPTVIAKSKNNLTSSSQGALVPRPKVIKEDTGAPLVVGKKSSFNFTDLIQRLRMKDAHRPSPVTTTYGTTLGTIEPTTPAQSASFDGVPPYMDKKKFELLKRNSIISVSPTASKSSKKKSSGSGKKISGSHKKEKTRAEKPLEKEVLEGKQVQNGTDATNSLSSKRRKKYTGGYKPNSSKFKRKKSSVKGLTLNQISAIEAANFKLVSLETQPKASNSKNGNEVSNSENLGKKPSKTSTSSRDSKVSGKSEKNNS
ncbi:unnamed protein product [Allacma fusca]|uniref:Tubulin glycylase 3A n=1 Tax=Allacma fusca TaxID=39272 RepID=A0A8J2KV44_9HEXA|nr:unnamed protein product [Allacma fusca]